MTDPYKYLPSMHKQSSVKFPRMLFPFTHTLWCIYWRDYSNLHIYTFSKFVFKLINASVNNAVYSPMFILSNHIYMYNIITWYVGISYVSQSVKSKDRKYWEIDFMKPTEKNSVNRHISYNFLYRSSTTTGAHKYGRLICNCRDLCKWTVIYLNNRDLRSSDHRR